MIGSIDEQLKHSECCEECKLARNLLSETSKGTVELLREYRDKLADALDLIKRKDEDFVESMRWMAQTVHQAYHTDLPETWRECPRSVCSYARQLVAGVLGPDKKI